MAGAFAARVLSETISRDAGGAGRAPEARKADPSSGRCPAVGADKSGLALLSSKQMNVLNLNPRLPKQRLSQILVHRHNGRVILLKIARRVANEAKSRPKRTWNFPKVPAADLRPVNFVRVCG